MRPVRILRVDDAPRREGEGREVGVDPQSFFRSGRFALAMPYAEDRVARLYYDRGCGSCTLLARVAVGASHRHLEAIPLDAPAAQRDLADLLDEVRFGSAHLVTDASRRTGSDIVNPLLGLALGEKAARLVERIPVADRALRWLYRTLLELPPNPRLCGGNV